MKKQIKSKLGLKKFQISKINNPQSILGGINDGPITPLTNPNRIDDNEEDND